MKPVSGSAWVPALNSWLQFLAGATNSKLPFAIGPFSLRGGPPLPGRAGFARHISVSRLVIT